MSNNKEERHLAERYRPKRSNTETQIKKEIGHKFQRYDLISASW